MRHDLDEALKALILYYYTYAEDDGGIKWELLDKLIGNVENAYVMQKLKEQNYGV